MYNSAQNLHPRPPSDSTLATSHVVRKLWHTIRHATTRFELYSTVLTVQPFNSKTFAPVDPPGVTRLHAPLYADHAVEHQLTLGNTSSTHPFIRHALCSLRLRLPLGTRLHSVSARIRPQNFDFSFARYYGLCRLISGCTIPHGTTRLEILLDRSSTKSHTRRSPPLPPMGAIRIDDSAPKPIE